jgi:hypothetical protein
MSRLAPLTKPLLGAMLGEFRFSADTPLVVPGEAGVAEPLSEIPGEFSMHVAEPMRRMEGTPFTVQTRFGWAWVVKREDAVLATIRAEGGDELAVTCTSYREYAQVDLSCRTALFTIEQSAAVTLGLAGQRSCEVKTHMDWVWPDLTTVKLGRTGGDAAAWKGVAEAPEYKQLPRRMIERIASAILTAMGEGWGRLYTKSRYRRPTVAHFSAEREAKLDLGSAGSARVRNRALLYPLGMRDFLAAAALMRPDIFPFRAE